MDNPEPDSMPAAEPPTGPEAGWYPEPSGQPGLRWWDGRSWTDHHRPLSPSGPPTPVPPPPSPTGFGPTAAAPLAPLGEWLSRSFRLMLQEAGHFLPMVLLTLAPGYLGLSVAVWYGFRGAIVTSDRTTGDVTFEGGSGPALVAAAVAAVVLLLLFHLLYAAACRHFLAVGAGQHGEDNRVHGAGLDPDPPTGFQPSTTGSAVAEAEDDGVSSAPWSLAMKTGLLRWPPVSATFLIRFALYWGLLVLLSVLTSVSPVFVLLVPFWPLVAALAWVRFSVSGVVAAVGDHGLGRPAGESLATSMALTRYRYWPLFGRLLALAMVGLSLIVMGNLIGGIVSAIAGGQPSGAVDPFAERVVFDQVLPTNPASFAISWLFLAFGAGAWQILSAAGHSLMYADLKGAGADDAFHP